MRRHLLRILCLAAAGCAASSAPKSERSPEQAARVKEAIKSGEIRYGMTTSEVLASWGKPARKSTTRHRGRRVTVWAYAFTDVYFDRDGYVVGWR
ncbi:MAG: hypothetical protein ACYTEZ_18960 [Planctomycetota bacterium]|jgi:hypothetical protein